MRLPALIAAAIGVIALVVTLLLERGGMRVMPSYLAAWLFWVALPVGALPLVMGMELAGLARSYVMPPLRRMLVLLPVAAVFAIPILLRVHSLYPWTQTPQHGLAVRWFSPGFFIGRMIVFLLIWVVLALVFLRSPPAGKTTGRRGLAILGLLLHLFIGTLAATDWAMSIDMGFGSSCFGLLLIIAQCGTALSAAVLLAGGGRPIITSTGQDEPGEAGEPSTLPQQFAVMMLAVLGAWFFLHFTQFLVVWSADLPREVVWYQHRGAGLGAAAEWLGFIGFVLALFLLLPRRLAGQPRLVAAVAALLLLVHLVEMYWLITPAVRGRFTLTVSDGLTMLGVCGLSIATLLMRRPAVGGSHGYV
ncbi:hypothetical protein [Rhodopila sp.]|uniref:hypothetical protein n=1 Tax=Rhodopila sp. TaxID=2480087 RepID=UPI003D0A0ABD